MLKGSPIEMKLLIRLRTRAGGGDNGHGFCISELSLSSLFICTELEARGAALMAGVLFDPLEPPLSEGWMLRFHFLRYESRVFPVSLLSLTIFSMQPSPLISMIWSSSSEHLWVSIYLEMQVSKGRM